LAGDVIDEGYAKALVDLALQTYGRLDIAFNNAGTLGASGATPEIPLEAWSHTINTNLNSAFLGAKYQIPAMLQTGGSLIFTSSFVGYTVGMPEKAAYAASKSGVIGLTKALACEYGAHAIRVNALVPGGTDTPMAKEFGETPEVVEFVKQMHALKRTAMLVDGGVSINKT